MLFFRVRIRNKIREYYENKKICSEKCGYKTEVTKQLLQDRIISYGRNGDELTCPDCKAPLREVYSAEDLAKYLRAYQLLFSVEKWKISDHNSKQFQAYIACSNVGKFIFMSHKL